MPSLQGRLSAPEAAALVEFIKSLRSENVQNVSSKEPSMAQSAATLAAVSPSPALVALPRTGDDRGVWSWLLTLITSASA